jgi:hypothetical protein
MSLKLEAAARSPTEGLDMERNSEGVSGAGYLSDCRLMLRFALKTALDIPQALVDDIAKLDLLLEKTGQRAIADIGWPRATTTADDATARPDMPATELIITVHKELSKVIAPATALSLQTSEPPPGRHRFLGGMPLVVKAANFAALVCAVGFVLTAAPIAREAVKEMASEKTVAAAMPR